MDQRVAEQIRDNEMVSLTMPRGDARLIQKLIADRIILAQAELNGIRTNDVCTMPPQLIEQSEEDRRYQIDPWCSFLMLLNSLNDEIVDVIAADKPTSPLVDWTDIIVDMGTELFRYRKIQEDEWEQLRWEDFGWDWDDTVGYDTVCESVLEADAVFGAPVVGE